MIDYKEFFEYYGNLPLINETGFFLDKITVEEFAAAIEARMLDKLRKIDEENWHDKFEAQGK